MPTLTPTTLTKTSWILKGCPRCHGDLYVEYYESSKSESCLQCGFAYSNKPAGFLKKQNRQAVR